MQEAEYLTLEQVAESARITKTERDSFYKFCNEIRAQLSSNRASHRETWNFNWGQQFFTFNKSDFKLNGVNLEVRKNLSITLRETYYRWAYIEAKSKIEITTYHAPAKDKNVTKCPLEFPDHDTALLERQSSSSFSFHAPIPLKQENDLNATEIASIVGLSDRQVTMKLLELRLAWERYSYELYLHHKEYTEKPDSIEASISTDSNFYVSEGRQIKLQTHIFEIGLRRDYSKVKMVTPFCINQSLIPEIFPNYKKRTALTSQDGAQIPEEDKHKYLLREVFLKKHLPHGYHYQANFLPFTDEIRKSFDEIISSGKNPYQDRTINLNYRGYPIPAYLFCYTKDHNKLNFRISDDAADVLKAVPEVASKIEFGKSKKEEVDNEWLSGTGISDYYNDLLTKLGSFSFNRPKLYEQTITGLFCRINQWEQESAEATKQGEPSPQIRHNGHELSPYDIGLSNLSGQLTVVTHKKLIDIIFDPVEHLMRSMEMVQTRAIIPVGYENWFDFAQRIWQQTPEKLRPFISNCIVDKVIEGLQNSPQNEEKPDFRKIKVGKESTTTVLNDRAKTQLIAQVNELIAVKFPEDKFAIPEKTIKRVTSISRF